MSQKVLSNNLSASPLLAPAQQDLGAKVLAVNTSVCSAGAQVNATDLQSLNATLFSALITLVGYCRCCRINR